MPKRPPPREESAAEDSADTSKRFRAVIDESADEFLCPITQDLPLDPVIAEDGKVYDREAIEDWLKQHQRSPITNLAMGTKLVPATQIKNMIERMVRADALPEDKCAAWKKRIAQQKEVDEIRRKAEDGDGEAAYALAKLYSKGGKGLCKDEARAIGFYKMAAEAGHASAMGIMSGRYVSGQGVERNPALALRWAAAAVEWGDGRGMVILGDMYKTGSCGLPVDMEAAFKLISKGSELGYSNSYGLYKLGTMHEKGKGTVVDMEKAEAIMRRAMAHSTATAADVQRARFWLTKHGLQV